MFETLFISLTDLATEQKHILSFITLFCNKDNFQLGYKDCIEGCDMSEADFLYHTKDLCISHLIEIDKKTDTISLIYNKLRFYIIKQLKLLYNRPILLKLMKDSSLIDILHNKYIMNTMTNIYILKELSLTLTSVNPIKSVEKIKEKDSTFQVKRIADKKPVYSLDQYRTYLVYTQYVSLRRKYENHNYRMSKKPRDTKHWKSFEKTWKLCLDYKINVMHFLISQFEMLRDWKKCPYPYPNMLSTDGAIERYYQWINQNNSRPAYIGVSRKELTDFERQYADRLITAYGMSDDDAIREVKNFFNFSRII